MVENIRAVVASGKWQWGCWGRGIRELSGMIIMFYTLTGIWVTQVYALVETHQMVLAGIAQWTECQPANGKVVSSNPSQGTCLGCRPGPWLGACERQPIDVSLTYIHVSLLLFLPPSPLSKNIK